MMLNLRGSVLVAAVACAVCVAGCNDDPVYQDSDPCPGGEKVARGDKDYCVFVITETGFLCPESLPNGYAVEGTGDALGVCSADPMEDPGDVQRAAKQAAQDGQIGDQPVDSQVADPDTDGDRDGGDPDTGGVHDIGGPDAGPVVDAGVDGPDGGADIVPDEPVERSNKLDILWIVDNSGSMCEEQAAVREAAADFVAPLVASGLDLQIGIITTDMFDPVESGRLQTTFDAEPGASCSIQIDTQLCRPSYPTLLRSGDYVDAEGAFSRDLGCMLTQGTRGNGFEMGLEAALVATSSARLDGPNAGLVRPDADLALVFLTDENDCSDRGALDLVNGNVCEWESDGLVPVATYREHFRALKAGRNVLVATIIAPDNGVRHRAPEMVIPSCVSDAGEGYQGWRYEAFRHGFASGWSHSVCDGPYDVVGLARFLTP